MPSAGRVRVDRFFSYWELPEAAKREHDWAAKDEDTQFVRRFFRDRTPEFIPLENFERLSGGKTPSGKKADGFAPDSYFSGTAILLNSKRARENDMDYETWPEYL